MLLPHIARNLKRPAIYLIFSITVLLTVLPFAVANAKTVLRVGVYDNRPTIFMDKNEKPGGLFIDILEDIAEKEHWSLEYVYGQWTEIYQYMMHGEIDLLPAIAFSNSRERYFHFTDETVMANWAQLYVPDNLKTGSLLDLQGKRIAVKAGDIHFAALQKLTRDFNIECRFIEVDDYTTVFEMLDAKYLNYGVVNRLFGDANKKYFKVHVAPVVFNPIEMRFAAPKNQSRDVIATIDSYLVAYKYAENSIYQRAVNKWLIPENQKKIPMFLWYSLGAASAGTLLFFGLMVLFKDQVRKRTRELTKANTQLATEITERAKAEDSLRSSSERINAFFRSVNDAIFVHPLKEEGFGFFIEINQVACERYGYSRKEFLNLTVKDITTEKEALYYGKSDVRKQLADTRHMIFETVHIKKNGETFPVEINTNTVQLDGKTVLLAVARDITDRKVLHSEKAHLTQQLQQAQKMDAIGRLAGGIAHDFNNMLGVISGNAEIALFRLDPQHTLFTNLQEIIKATERSANLTRQLLAFARKQAIKPVILDLNDTVSAMLSMLQTLIQENIQLIWKPAGDMYPTFIDPGQIDQILANLCINARDAINGVGEIIIETQKIHIGTDPNESYREITHGDYVLLTVTDNGCGMDEKTIAKIFDPFFTTKKIGQGTGLGLATVYGIVKQNSGYIYAESVVGKGTTCKIYLPRYAGQPEPADVVKESSFKGGEETILLVEDEEPLLEIAERMLDKVGYKVLTANSPTQALETVKQCPESIDLLLTDVVMPEMSGLELSNQLTLVIPGLKSLFMSGYTSDTISQHGVLDEGINFISKPFSQPDLLNALRNVLDELEH